MADTLTITKTEHGRVPVLHLAGTLNAQSENQLVEAAQAAHAANPDALLIDLKDTDMVMSAGLRGLQKIYKLYTPPDEPAQWEAAHPGEIYKSPRVKLADAAPQVHYVLSLAGFLQNIPIYPDAQQALDSF
ncbi:MAG TPA: STAS domain-containing protein [Anaerolineales bacterium]